MSKYFCILFFIITTISCSQIDKDGSSETEDINQIEEKRNEYPETVLGIKLGESYNIDTILKNNMNILYLDKIENVVCYNLFSQNINTYEWLTQRMSKIPDNIKAPSKIGETKELNILAFPKITQELDKDGNKVITVVRLSLCNSNYMSASAVFNPDGSSTMVRNKRIYEEDYDAVFDLLLKTYNGVFLQVEDIDGFKTLGLSKDGMNIYFLNKIDSINSMDYKDETYVWEVDIIYTLDQVNSDKILKKPKPIKLI